MKTLLATLLGLLALFALAGGVVVSNTAHTSAPRAMGSGRAARSLGPAGAMGPGGPEGPRGRVGSAGETGSGRADIAAQVRRLSPEQLAGQRVIYSYSGPIPPSGLLARIRRAEAAGVIFFADNIQSRSQIRRVIGRLQQAAAHSRVKEPLLMMTDQEGGEVRRLPGAPTRSEKEIGESPHPVTAAQGAGRGAGRNLRGAGMNVNLAPVLDVYRTEGNFIDQYGRSYSRDPHKVAQLGAAFIRAQQRRDVAATAKHFPGLGAASRGQDTDAEPVRLSVPLRTLRSVDELPYRAAISTGVRLVMVSWATYTALDGQRPAGFSRAVVQRELRGRLGFTGVTITDALEAGALRPYGATSNRSMLAARTGMDLLLCAEQSVGEGSAALNTLAAALRRGELDRSSFRASVERIVALRSSLRP